MGQVFLVHQVVPVGQKSVHESCDACDAVTVLCFGFREMKNQIVKSKRCWFAVFVLVAIAGGIVLTKWAWRPSAEQLISSARKALLRGDVDEARQQCLRAVTRYPRFSKARLFAAEIELASNRREAALEMLEQVIDDGSPSALIAIGNAGDLLFELHRLTKAEDRFRRVLTLNPQNVLAKKRLATLQALAGRRLEATQLYFEIVKSGEFDTHELALLGDAEQVFENPELVERLANPSADDQWKMLAAARFALFRHESTKAASLYRQLINTRSADLDLQSGLGRSLLDVGTDAEFLEWHSRLPNAADEHPDIWDVRGRFAQKRSEHRVAIRCYLEAIRRDANLRHAHYQLSSLLHQIGDAERARAFKQRTDDLNALSDVLAIIHVDSTRGELLERAGRLCSSLGRPWETWGWLHATAAATRRIELRIQADRLMQTFDGTTPLVLPEGQLARQFDLSEFPLPKWEVPSGKAKEQPSLTGSRWINVVKFKDLAQEAELKFTYFNGHDPKAQGMQIWEGPGGGVGVLDYDGDTWPDLYFTQGCDWPPQPGQTKYLDRLFRNLGNGHFADVSLASGLGDDRFSHGIAVGDYDSDGFPDIHVSNIGVNRLYRNCGDGTFFDVTAASGLNSHGWSTSGLIADLNGDSFPEIYEVTYLSGREPFEHVCHDKQRDNAPRTCSPAVFQAEQDRLYFNRGDGTFEDISAAAGIHASDGKGLGIVAGDFDGSGRLSLFVANDTTANFLFVNLTASSSVTPKFVEQGIISGCAFDLGGKAQASMGVAADDADGDGLIDLFVTNFYNEYNVLYRQLPGGVFSDVSSEARLKEPSLVKLGFGTQFLDGDLDGWPDLVVANGHVDDFRSHGIPFRMQAQYFANLGAGRFAELPSEQLGNYFQQEFLGRGLARLDWNRDGREDFVVSNLDSPVSLVTNQTAETGHFLALQLRGVESNRDAIGAVVRINAGGQTRTKQLTAGDGYQASNQRQLVFGLGDSVIVDELAIRWPSGREQTFRNVAADTEYLLIERRAELTQIPKP